LHYGNDENTENGGKQMSSMPDGEGEEEQGEEESDAINLA